MVMTYCMREECIYKKKKKKKKKVEDQNGYAISILDTPKIILGTCIMKCVVTLLHQISYWEIQMSINKNEKHKL